MKRILDKVAQLFQHNRSNEMNSNSQISATCGREHIVQDMPSSRRNVTYPKMRLRVTVHTTVRTNQSNQIIFYVWMTNACRK